MMRGFLELVKVALWRARYGMPRLELFQRGGRQA